MPPKTPKAPKIAHAEVIEAMKRILALLSPVAFTLDEVEPLTGDERLHIFILSLNDWMRGRAGMIEDLKKRLAESEKREKDTANDFRNYKEGVRDARGIAVPVPFGPGPFGRF